MSIELTFRYSENKLEMNRIDNKSIAYRTERVQFYFIWFVHISNYLTPFVFSLAMSLSRYRIKRIRCVNGITSAFVNRSNNSKLPYFKHVRYDFDSWTKKKKSQELHWKQNKAASTKIIMEVQSEFLFFFFFGKSYEIFLLFTVTNKTCTKYNHFSCLSYFCPNRFFFIDLRGKKKFAINCFIVSTVYSCPKI